MFLGQLAKPIHAAHSAVCVLPDQLLILQVATDNNGTPSQNAKLQNSLVP